jgi:hypothetical protein
MFLGSIISLHIMLKRGEAQLQCCNARLWQFGGPHAMEMRELVRTASSSHQLLCVQHAQLQILFKYASEPCSFWTSTRAL